MEPVLYEFDSLPLCRLQSYVFQRVTDRRLTPIYHAHDFYEVVFVLHGFAEQTVNGCPLLLREGEAVILRPGDAHAFLSQAEEIAVLSLAVKAWELSQMAAVYAPTLEAHILSADRPSPFSFPFSGETVVVETEFDCKALLSALLHAYITATDFAGVRPKLPPPLAALLEQMRDRGNLRRGIAAATEISHYSQCHLSRLVQRHFGLGLKEWINGLRLRAAYEELLLSDRSVTEITADVGFQSPSHFNKIFKERFGTTPAALRRREQVLTV